MEQNERNDIALKETPEGLALVIADQMVVADFRRMLPRAAGSNLRQEMLVRAARLKKKDTKGRGKDSDGPEKPGADRETIRDSAGHVSPSAAEKSLLVWDATAGLGEDSFLLAAAGYQVELYERDRVIAAALEDALRRAAEDPLLADIVSRMHLHKEDSINAMLQMAQEGEAAVRPDIILLDPMFPARRKSGLVKKKFQMLHQLEAPCEDEEALLHAAKAVNPRKIIIKRPLRGPYLADVKPSYSLKGKKIRYDCLIGP